MTSVSTPGLNSFAAALEKVTEMALPFAERAIGQSLEALHEIMAMYPPQPDRDRANPGNKPRPYNTYVRGIGQFPRSAFTSLNGNWQRKSKNAYKPGPKGGKVRRTSQQLDKKWRIRVERGKLEITGELRNEAGYSAYVLGHTDQSKATDAMPMQAKPHTETGWPNVDEALQKIQPKIDQANEEALDKLLQQIKAA